MAFQPTWHRKLNELTCAQKKPFQWKWEAEEGAERHITCAKCEPDGRLEAYQCRHDPAHFHIGHRR